MNLSDISQTSGVRRTPISPRQKSQAGGVELPEDTLTSLPPKQPEISPASFVAPSRSGEKAAEGEVQEPWTPPFKNWQTWEQAESVLAAKLPKETVKELKDTFDFASERHRGQTRPDGEAYSIHLLEVTDILVNGLGVTDKSSLQAGLLHDVVEDTPTSVDEVEMHFGPETASKVKWLTKPEAGAGESASEVRSNYLKAFRNAPEDVVQVKLADRLSNVQRLNNHPRPEKQRSYYKETVENIVPLAENQPWFQQQFQRWQTAFQHLES